MKLDINLRFLFSALFLILLTSTIYPTNSNAQTPDGTAQRADNVACGGNGTGIIETPGTTDCELHARCTKNYLFKNRFMY